MAKNTNTAPVAQPTNGHPIEAIAPAVPVAEAPATVSTPLDYEKTLTNYANFCSVRRTLEEVIVDFALTDEYVGPSRHAVAIDRRVVLSYYTAKRLLEALKVTVAQHEQIFGKVEIDPRRRVVQQTNTVRVSTAEKPHRRRGVSGIGSPSCR